MGRRTSTRRDRGSRTGGISAGRSPAYERRPDAGAFVCFHCGLCVRAEAGGTRHRNHCPRCLHSLHVDVAVGDRRSLCRGLMEPIAVWVREDGEVRLVHRCTRCGVIRANRLAGDDDEAAVLALAERAMQPGRAGGR